MNANTLIIKETQSGYCVRPLNWAGIIQDGILIRGESLFKSNSKYECEQYIIRQKLKGLIEDYPELNIVTVLNSNADYTDTFGNMYKNISNVEKGSIIKYEGRLFIKGKDSIETILSYIARFTTEEYNINWKDCILVYLE